MSGPTGYRADELHGELSEGIAARQQAVRPNHSFGSGRPCRQRHSEAMKMREAPWSGVAPATAFLPEFCGGGSFAHCKVPAAQRSSRRRQVRLASRTCLGSAEFNERTGNVYENKGRGQKVHNSGPLYAFVSARELTTLRASTNMGLRGTRAFSKVRTAQILRRSDQIGTPQDDRLGGHCGTPRDDSRGAVPGFLGVGARHGVPLLMAAWGIPGLLGMASAMSKGCQAGRVE